MKFVISKQLFLIVSLIVIVGLSIKIVNTTELSSTTNTQTEATLKIKAQSKAKASIKSQIKVKSKTRAQKSYSYAAPPGATPPAKKEEPASNGDKKGAKSPTKDILLSDWLLISSPTFKNPALFPEIMTEFSLPNVRIKTDGHEYRINDAHSKDKNKENSPAHNKLFWFRLSKKLIYYSSTKEDLNILGGNKIEHIVDAASMKINALGFYCFSIREKSGHDWNICSENEKTRNKWYCKIQELRGQELDKTCDGAPEVDANVIIKNVFKFFFHNYYFLS